ncbi:MAG: hypothetical protein JOZ07_04410 [Solirubrobacterales bacterium]|nr:hypothetical protein [Solirubrobacterales bacterium]
MAGLRDQLAAAGAGFLGFLRSLRPVASTIGRPCTCGNTSKHGPCPRHGKLT